MADKTIADLTTKGSPATGDVIEIDDGASFKVTLGSLPVSSAATAAFDAAGAAAAAAAASQPLDADLTAIAALSTTSFGRARLTDADAATARVSLGIDKRTANGDSNYVVLATDKLIVTSAALTTSRTWTLPAASAVSAGYEVIVADEAGGVTSTNTLIISRAGADTIDGATTETMMAAYGMRRFFSDGVSKWTVDKGVVRLNDTQTLTNKRITNRLQTAADATSITPTGDSIDLCYQLNTQATGTLTINAPTGTPSEGDSFILKLKATNVQTFSWNAIYRGGTDIALPTVSTAAKIDRMGFRYDSVGSKWDIVSLARGY